MKLVRKSEFLDSIYQCSLCKVGYKSFGKIQEHMLKDHLLNIKNPQYFPTKICLGLNRFQQILDKCNFCNNIFPLRLIVIVASFKLGVE